MPRQRSPLLISLPRFDGFICIHYARDAFARRAAAYQRCCARRSMKQDASLRAARRRKERSDKITRTVLRAMPLRALLCSERCSAAARALPRLRQRAGARVRYFMSVEKSVVMLPLMLPADASQRAILMAYDDARCFRLPREDNDITGAFADAARAPCPLFSALRVAEGVTRCLYGAYAMPMRCCALYRLAAYMLF